MERNTGLIVAMDVTRMDRAVEIASEVAECVDAIKVGYPLVLSEGLSVISRLADYAPVIADFKVADIPNTDELICEQVFKAGACGVIVHGFTGEDSLKACIGVAQRYDGDIYVVSEMSHPGGSKYFQPIADEIASMAYEFGATGIVAPATRPERVKHLRSIIGDGLSIISPGVGAQGGKASDVIAAGANWIIVGRSIYNSENPKETAMELVTGIGI
ncbi:orotidine-5'-phosphate decarboxylase [Methanohalophilus portucalensis]|uniref:Orotidine 5'-phosphate decarboxylase n=2 Tax=Methanohalophilus portucalensis TaxID=39664 RepID=A0A1L9C4D3_9EURY|nr:orotidine-5'-phosphate decarboxylase [Methanohalophilus portucalensis]ATU07844.1 orotidine 5'-phosphate decarboxylase [Methanohalophilus portucalensis]OJH49331.1 orotidine-5'-phosphate decarboxylase [Methanohalophilus portucalensis FDF-1]RNI11559.1 orotidine-5'-phosphate decarboxylase [Methanohalophilus portucalensis FDF-1]SMH41748.1 orotidine-5'-phosphate decarboxylase [Methanohalophilus portucalensis FDF-1]